MSSSVTILIFAFISLIILVGLCTAVVHVVHNLEKVTPTPSSAAAGNDIADIALSVGAIDDPSFYTQVDDLFVPLQFDPRLLPPPFIYSKSTNNTKLLVDPTTQSSITYTPSDNKSHILSGTLSVDISYYITSGTSVGFACGIADVSVTPAVPLTISYFHQSGLTLRSPGSGIYGASIVTPFYMATTPGQTVQFIGYIQYGNGVHVSLSSLNLMVTELPAV